MQVVNLERKSGGQLRAESGGQYQRKMQILNKFTQNPDTLNHFKEHMLLTINMLIIIKDQQFIF